MILLLDGFDMFAATDYALRGYNSAFDGMITGRFGFGKACTTSTPKFRQIPQSAASVFMQAGFMSNGSTGQVAVFTGYEGGTIQFQIVFVHGPDVFKAYRGDAASGILLGVSSQVTLGQALWEFLELNVNIAASGGAVALKFNGVQVMNLTNQNTRNTGNAWITAAGFGGGPQADAWDDFVVFDASGAAPNGFIGDRRIHTVFPVGDGTHQDFTQTGSSNHWSNVDEPTPNTSDGVFSTTVGNIDTYVMDDLPVGASNPDAIQINLCVLKSDAGARSSAYVVRQGTTDFVGTSVVTPASAVIQSTLFAQNPATSAPWLATDFNADEFGVKVTA